jgi:hypothetical protein
MSLKPHVRGAAWMKVQEKIAGNGVSVAALLAA